MRFRPILSLAASLFLAVSLLVSLSSQLWASEDALYSVAKVQSKAAPSIDADLSDLAWQRSALLQTEFHYPWRQEQSPATRFQALYDDQYLYLSFQAEDKEIVVLDSIEAELDIGNEDRVEIFFAPAAIEAPVHIDGQCSLPFYYGIEIDARGRVLDFSARYYRRFDFDWDMPGLETAFSTGDGSYQGEVKIPLQSLRQLGLVSEEQRIMAGVFRGEFSHEDGALTSKWISWVDPKTAQPDFHISSAFGSFQLLD